MFREFSQADAAVEEAIAALGKKIVLGTPLGLGKGTQVLNAFYRRAKADPSVELSIFSALTLEKPVPKSFLEERFLAPFLDRVFGDYEDLLYEKDRMAGSVPSNIRIVEFYFPAGKQLSNPYAQRNYLSANYTHVARDMFASGANVIVQLVARRGSTFSLSSNPDVTLDLVKLLRESERPWKIIAEVNNELPFMFGDCEVDESYFHSVVDNRGYYKKLFGPPKESVSSTDYAIGLNASALIKDGGCIQIGIGALGDAVTYGLKLRHEENDTYREVLNALGTTARSATTIETLGGMGPFRQGLFGASEMFVDGFMHLYRAGILRKKVYDHVGLQRLLNEGKISEELDSGVLNVLHSEKLLQDPPTRDQIDFLKRFGIVKTEWDDFESLSTIAPQAMGKCLKEGRVVHAGFFLGPQEFYEFLRAMPDEERRLFNMTSVGGINQLYWSEEIDTLQRQNARFINTCMMATLLGAVVSDGLEDGRMVSGVGGQYNFVAMAHAIENGRSILKCRSFRMVKGEARSNILWSYGHCTIPRHLRDIVITEYGIADLRGKTDEDVIREMLKITDSRFQEGLLRTAKAAGKIERSYEIPNEYRNNTPKRIELALAPFRSDGHFVSFPFGTDFTDEELRLGRALRFLKERMGSVWGRLGLFLGLCLPVQPADAALLSRMGLLKPTSLKERVFKRVVRYALDKTK